MKRTIKILAFLSFLSLIPIIILILFSPYFLSAYKDEISKYLGETLHRKVEIRKVSLTVMNGLGLSIEGLKIHNDPGYKNDLLLNLDSFNLSMEFWPLLRQKIESHGIVVKNPRLFLETNLKGVSNLDTLGGGKEAPPSAVTSSRPEVFPGVKISKLQVVNGSISDENNFTQDTVSLQGIQIDLPQLNYSPEDGQKSLIEGIKVEGEIRISQGNINHFHFEHLNGQIAMEKMIFILKNWALNSYGGTVSGNLQLNLNEKLPRFHLTGKTEKLNLQALLNDNLSTQNLMEGDFYSSLSADGAGLNIADLERNLSGKGNFLLQKGVLKSVNLLKQISILSKLPMIQQNDRLNETKLDPLKGEFTINHGKVIFQSLKGTTPEGEVTGDGSLDFHKMADFKIKVLLNKKETEKLPREAKTYLADNNDQASFPITLQGNITSPFLRLETSGIKQKVIKEGVKQGLKSLLDRFSPK